MPGRRRSQAALQAARQVLSHSPDLSPALSPLSAEDAFAQRRAQVAMQNRGMKAGQQRVVAGMQPTHAFQLAPPQQQQRGGRGGNKRARNAFVLDNSRSSPVVSSAFPGAAAFESASTSPTFTSSPSPSPASSNGGGGLHTVRFHHGPSTHALLLSSELSVDEAQEILQGAFGLREAVVGVFEPRREMIFPFSLLLACPAAFHDTYSLVLEQSGIQQPGQQQQQQSQESEEEDVEDEYDSEEEPSSQPQQVRWAQPSSLPSRATQQPAATATTSSGRRIRAGPARSALARAQQISRIAAASPTPSEGSPEQSEEEEELDDEDDDEEFESTSEEEEEEEEEEESTDEEAEAAAFEAAVERAMAAEAAKKRSATSSAQPTHRPAPSRITSKQPSRSSAPPSSRSHPDPTPTAASSSSPTLSDSDEDEVEARLLRELIDYAARGGEGEDATAVLDPEERANEAMWLEQRFAAVEKKIMEEERKARTRQRQQPPRSWSSPADSSPSPSDSDVGPLDSDADVDPHWLVAEQTRLEGERLNLQRQREEIEHLKQQQRVLQQRQADALEKVRQNERARRASEVDERRQGAAASQLTAATPLHSYPSHSYAQQYATFQQDDDEESDEDDDVDEESELDDSQEEEEEEEDDEESELEVEVEFQPSDHDEEAGASAPASAPSSSSPFSFVLSPKELSELGDLQSRTGFASVSPAQLHSIFRRFVDVRDGTLSRVGFDQNTAEFVRVAGLQEDPVAARKAVLVLNRMFDLFDVSTSQDRQNWAGSQFVSGEVPFAMLATGLNIICRGDRDEKIKLSFSAFDRSGSGFLSVSELTLYFLSFFTVLFDLSVSLQHKILTHTSVEDLASATAHLAIQEAGDVTTGRISFAQFKRWYLQNQAAEAPIVQQSDEEEEEEEEESEEEEGDDDEEEELDADEVLDGANAALEEANYYAQLLQQQHQQRWGREQLQRMHRQQGRTAQL